MITRKFRNIQHKRISANPISITYDLPLETLKYVVLLLMMLMPTCLLAQKRETIYYKICSSSYISTQHFLYSQQLQGNIIFNENVAIKFLCVCLLAGCVFTMPCLSVLHTAQSFRAKSKLHSACGLNAINSKQMTPHDKFVL